MMEALWDIGACASSALPGAFRILWDLRWHAALRRQAELTITADSGGHTAEGDQAVTLIRCSHNDLPALKQTWSAWRGQHFPEGWSVEWLVVDDGSDDGTLDWLEAQAAGDPMLTILHHDKKLPGKKHALAAGIRAARHDRLVMTDADCMPRADWAHSMARALRDPVAAHGGLDLALGVCLPDGGPRLLRFDGLRVAFQYCAEAALGRPYMGVGRNLSYRRSTWMTVGGFDGHSGLVSGDDDLFVQDVKCAGFTIGLAPPAGPTDGIVTLPSADPRDGWDRKRRHLGTHHRYARADRWRLGADSALDILIVLAATAGSLGLLHSAGWIPIVALMLAFLVRSITLSSFSRVWGNGGMTAMGVAFWGPVRWTFLATATLGNIFTSSPKWTQRAPTSRS